MKLTNFNIKLKKSGFKSYFFLMYSYGYLIFLISLCRILIIKKVDLYLKRLQKIKCKLRLLANVLIETGRLTSLIPITRSKIFAEIKILDFFSAISKNNLLTS